MDIYRPTYLLDRPDLYRFAVQHHIDATRKEITASLCLHYNQQALSAVIPQLLSLSPFVGTIRIKCKISIVVLCHIRPNVVTHPPLSSPDRTDTSFRPFLRPADRRTPMAFPRVSLEICLPTYLPIIQTSNAEPTKKSHRCKGWTEPAFSRQHVPFHTNFK